MSASLAVPGDPDVVASLARQYASVARVMLDASSRLRALDGDGSRSDAVDAFLAKADDLAERLGRVRGRYDEAGAALLEYSGALRLAVDDAAAASRARVSAEDDLVTAEKLRRYHQDAADATEDGPLKDHDQRQADRQRYLADEAAWRVTAAHRRLDTAREDSDRAAERAVARLDVATDDGIRDAVFDDFAGWMAENDAWISDVLDVMGNVCIVLTVLSFFFPLAWIGLALVALTVAIAVGATARAAAGTGSWAEAVLALASCATMGVGGALSGTVRAELSSLRATRTAALEAAGAPPSFATAWMRKTFTRYEGRSRTSELFLALGDSDVAHALWLTKRPRPGEVAGDAEALLGAVRRARSFSAASTAWDVASEGISWFGWSTWIEQQTTRRIPLGTRW